MSEDRALELSREIVQTLFGAYQGDMAVRFWDGSQWPDEQVKPTTLVLNHPGALRAMFWPATELSLGEAYLYNDFDIVGPIEPIFGMGQELIEKTSSWQSKLGLAWRLLRLPSQRSQQITRRGRAQMQGQEHSIERDREAIRYHYDVSNDFYALWLDRQMVYSCAYFASADEDLDTAQARKLDYICRKLRLQPGQRLLDLGCGWGGLLIHAAREYGVDATGITLSQPQVDLAQERIAAAGLGDRCRVLLQDYRELHEPEGYDALVSVGMFEHVGQALLPSYFQQAWHLLRPQGVFLNHGIACRATDPPERGPTFSDTYVFPDGELVPISVSLTAAEDQGFEVRDVESLREHYALTLRHWVRSLESRHDEALQHVDEPIYRVWRLYMSGSAHGFASGRLNVYQALLAKPTSSGSSGLSLQRADWYA